MPVGPKSKRAQSPPARPLLRPSSRVRLCLIALLATISMTGAVRASAASEPEQVATALGRQADTLQSLLDAVRDARGEPLRQNAMQRHWEAMQVYMRESLRHTTDGSSSEAGTDPADCRTVGGAWKPLSFPGQVRSAAYLDSMQALTGRMRAELLAVHDARSQEELDTILRIHWRNNYEALQRMRGMDWMFDGWKPVASDDARPPDPGSDGARLTQAFCSVCHAVPPARLHTAQEWDGVMRTMNRHIVTSDTGTPLCMQAPTDEELAKIRAYLVHYAR